MRVWLIIIILMLTGCGTSRKSLKTQVTTNTETIIDSVAVNVKNTESKTQTITESISESLTEQTNTISKVIRTVEYGQPDSTGVQPILRVTEEFENSIMVNSSKAQDSINTRSIDSLRVIDSLATLVQSVKNKAEYIEAESKTDIDRGAGVKKWTWLIGVVVILVIAAAFLLYRIKKK